MVKEEVFYPRRCYKLFRIVKNLRWTGASPFEVLEFFNGDLLLPLFFNENLPPFFSSPDKNLHPLLPSLGISAEIIKPMKIYVL